MTRFVRLIVAAALLFAAALLGGCGGQALGDASPPASLDPASPRLAAIDVAFDRETLEVPAGQPFVLAFENREAVSHNVSIYAGAALQRRLFEGVLFAGPATRWYSVPALDAGTYVFLCDLHPTMRGELQAG
jgi:plastocyanin